jgi:hypothetical protein
MSMAKLMQKWLCIMLPSGEGAFPHLRPAGEGMIILSRYSLFNKRYKCRAHSVKRDMFEILELDSFFASNRASKLDVELVIRDQTIEMDDGSRLLNHDMGMSLRDPPLGAYNCFASALMKGTVYGPAVLVVTGLYEKSRYYKELIGDDSGFDN